MASDTPSTVEPPRWAAAVVFLGLWLVLMAGGRGTFFRDPGTFWHVRTGEWIVDHGRFLDHDPYTFTFAGSPWTPYEWLAEVLMAATYRLAGLDGLLLASSGVIALTFAMLFARIARTGLHWLPAVVVTGLGLAAAASHFHARPHLLTILFFAVLVLRLQDYEAGRCGRRGLWWLVPLFAVWANTHGGVLGGYGTVAVVAAGWLGFAAVGWPSPVTDRRTAGSLVLWAVVVPVTALATPYGLGVPRTWLEIMRMSELPRIISEHAPVDPSEPSSWSFFALGLVYVVLLAGVRLRPRVTWLLPLVWFVLGCDRVRHAPLFAITAVAAIADFFPHTVWARWLTARPDLYRPPSDPVRTSRTAIGFAAAMVAVSLGLQAGGVRVPVVGAGWARFPESEWPLALVPTLKQEAGDRTDIPIFNEYEFGGFLIFFAPEYRPFVDDRCEVFGGPWLAEFVAAGAGDPSAAMAKWQAEYPRFDHALTRPGSGFDRYFERHPGWEEMARCDAGRLWRRKLPQV